MIDLVSYSYKLQESERFFTPVDLVDGVNHVATWQYGINNYLATVYELIVDHENKIVHIKNKTLYSNRKETLAVNAMKMHAFLDLASRKNIKLLLTSLTFSENYPLENASELDNIFVIKPKDPNNNELKIMRYTNLYKYEIPVVSFDDLYGIDGLVDPIRQLLEYNDYIIQRISLKNKKQKKNKNTNNDNKDIDDLVDFINAKN
ncbi:hypothetical protein PmNV_083 [Penaeus monodon nudivirus]|uniref:Uncharacterized protein n=1 Tax=Penaeus monodon nudivirus TaxID=1529056 RepID=A0A076FJ07_9VIRU|nr:hypothetical protein PmNV_083 [Penaeus monodon nudivirus]AII15871.1 hypothetical protein PmNV_083 [Penaeus monodon nudivirus]